MLSEAQAIIERSAAAIEVMAIPEETEGCDIDHIAGCGWLHEHPLCPLLSRSMSGEECHALSRHRRSREFRRMLEAAFLIEADLDLAVMLGHVVKEARSMTGARCGALGVLNDDRTEFSEFLTVGLSADEEAAIGPWPTGKGVLGLLITDGQHAPSG